jgi:hypothetical protein
MRVLAISTSLVVSSASKEPLLKLVFLPVMFSEAGLAMFGVDIGSW